MTRILVVFALFSLALGTACGGKGGTDAANADNPFAKRKVAIDGYIAALEAAPDLDAAVAAGQAWLDANLKGYLDNCKVLVEHRKDVEKSKPAKDFPTDMAEYNGKLNSVAGIGAGAKDPVAMKKGMQLAKQLNSFFNCDSALSRAK